MDDKDYYSGLFDKTAGRLSLLFLGMFFGCIIISFIDKCGGREGNVKIERDTIFDTLTIEKPVPVYDTIIQYVKKKPIVLHDTAYIVNDTNIYITPDTQVVIPITQKVYEDSTYKAWVSGYLPSLDSLHVYRHTITITNTEYKQKKFSFGPQFGAGVDVTTGKFGIFLGFGGSYCF